MRFSLDVPQLADLQQVFQLTSQHGTTTDVAARHDRRAAAGSSPRCSHRVVTRHDPVEAHQVVAHRDPVGHDINY
ncbi:hypothetical protein ACIA8M_33700 [Streptomyces anulatus]